VHHPKAVYIAPHFSRFQLAEGDYLVVRSPDGQQAWHYSGLGRAERGLTEGGFWSGHIKGDTAILELYARNLGDGDGVEVDRYARGFTAKELADDGEIDPPDTLAICGVDDSREARCYLADEPEIYERSIAVARLLVTGTFACTGWLVGCEGHLMTNQHCIESQFDADNTDYEFMAEGGSCQASCSSWGACPGVVEATAAPLIRLDGPLDYALVQLPADLTTKYGFLQLREEGPEVGERIYVPQHPSHWGKRIAFESSHPADDGYCEVQTLNAPTCSGGAPDVGYYCDTRGGSSGAPVLGYADHRVVALHHCADCPNRAVNIVDVIASLGSDLPACAFGTMAGFVTLDAPRYSCDDQISITLHDDSLEGFGVHDVLVRSSTESSPELVSLTEIAPGIFSGAIPTTDAQFNAGDGELSLEHEDLIIVEYIDADDGDGGIDVVVEATADADCRIPVITKVDASEISGFGATVTWDTDEHATSTVQAGTATSESSFVRKHRVSIAGLAECSTQTFSVSSTDAVGNLGNDDNGGMLYRFETGKNTRPETTSADTPMVIPDFDPTAAVSTITIADTAIVQDVNVVVDIEHDYVGDLTLSLITPSGFPILLADRLGGAGQDYKRTLFDDEAQTWILDGSPPFLGAYQPQQSLSGADGIPAAGDWQLRIVDSNQPDGGVLEFWTLILTYPPQQCGPHAIYLSDTNSGDSCSSGNGSSNGNWDAGEQVEFSIALRNDGDLPLSGVTARVVPLGPEVGMIADAAIYGDLPVGETTASQSQNYRAQLSAGLDCGDELQFRLEIAANEGSWSETFRRVVGRPYDLSSVELDEDFDAGQIPAGWSVIDGSGDGFSWFVDDVFDPASCANIDPRPGIGGSWAAVDSDCAGAVDLDEQLITPIIDLSSADTVTLEFDHYFNHFQNEVADLDVRSSATAGAWVNVARFAEDTANSQAVEIDLTPFAAGSADAQVRWRYRNANFDWFWYVDNVKVSTTSIVACDMWTCSASATHPRPVPDGSAGTAPVQVARDDAAGTRLTIDYDDTCGSASTNLIYGPLDGVASYALAGSLCSIDDPAIWDPAPGGDIWFLIVGSNGAGVESSWGGSSGGERNGLAASGACGVALKDLSGTCP